MFTITIEVADEGIGIPKEDVLNIFNPFYRSN
jgi:signal transduction histidine kinase